MPQLDLVTFPSQIFWLAVFFLSFYGFVSGHFVSILHKITQIRSKKQKSFDDSTEEPGTLVVGRNFQVRGDITAFRLSLEQVWVVCLLL